MSGRQVPPGGLMFHTRHPPGVTHEWGLCHVWGGRDRSAPRMSRSPCTSCVTACGHRARRSTIAQLSDHRDRHVASGDLSRYAPPKTLRRVTERWVADTENDSEASPTSM